MSEELRAVWGDIALAHGSMDGEVPEQEMSLRVNAASPAALQWAAAFPAMACLATGFGAIGFRARPRRRFIRYLNL